MSRRRLGLRARLLALLLTVFGVLVLLASPLTYWEMSRSLHGDRDAYLLELARRAATEWSRRGTRERSAGGEIPPCLTEPAPPSLTTPGATHRPRHLLVADAGGRVLCSDGETVSLAPAAAADSLRGGAPTFADVRWSAEVLRVVEWPFSDAGGRPLVMEVGTSYMVIEGVLRRGLVFTIAFDVVAFALLLGGSWFLTGRAYAPIDRLISRVEGIDEDNLAQRLPSEGAGDEAARLVVVINRMLERLERAFSSQSRFSSDVAHEIRSPLTALRGQIEVALRRDRTPDEYRQVLDASLQEVARLSRLAEDLMSLARADAGTLQLSREMVDLRVLLRRVVERCRRQAGAKDVALRLRAPTAVRVVGDGDLLARVVENLVDNALIHSPRMDEVVLRLERTPDAAVITVADSGRGIAPEHLPRIFDRFYRVDPARSRDVGGTGLGLAIVRQLVELHGGRVTVDSEVGKGSAFTVSLPLPDTVHPANLNEV